MKKLSFLSLGALALLGMSGSAVAQDSQMMFVYQETVKPSMVQEYEAGTKEFIKAMAGSQLDPAAFQFQTIMTSEFDYFYVMQVDGFAGIDKMYANYQMMMESMGPEHAKKMQNLSSQAVTHGASFAIMLRPDLSYDVASTEISGDMPFRKYWWWHVIPGKEMELEAVAKEYAAMYTKHNVQNGFRIYQVMMGGDLPLYLVVASAKDEAEFVTRNKMLEESMGYEAQQLQMKALKVARKIVIQEGWVRPDLSYPQPMGETGGSN